MSADLDDRPGVPVKVEQTAISKFKQSTQAQTGHEWDWEESSEEIRNIWRLKAYNELTSAIPLNK